LHNVGSDLLLTFLEEAFPAPDERKTVVGTVNGAETRRCVSSKEMPSAFVFKTMTDAFAGRVTFFKVWSEPSRTIST
jgi:elongation factor G